MPGWYSMPSASSLGFSSVTSLFAEKAGLLHQAEELTGVRPPQEKNSSNDSVVSASNTISALTTNSGLVLSPFCAVLSSRTAFKSAAINLSLKCV